jgi:hypothetical protein
VLLLLPRSLLRCQLLLLRLLLRLLRRRLRLPLGRRELLLLLIPAREIRSGLHILRSISDTFTMGTPPREHILQGHKPAWRRRPSARRRPPPCLRSP